MRTLPADFLRGSYTPVVTPFRGGRVDLETFASLVDRQVREGSHGIVVCGTTGEASSLTVEERASLFDTAVGAAAGRVPVVAGTGSAAFEETLALTERAERSGVDALLIVTPYYIKPSQAGLVSYYAAVTERTSKPWLIYHIPGRAAVTLTPATVERIGERSESLVGLKHASTDLEFVTETLVRMGPEFRIFCGLEALSLPMLVLGAAGLMNAVGNLAAARVAALCDAVGAGDLERARALHVELFELNRSIFVDTNPVPLKYMMTRLGMLASGELRLPLIDLDPAQRPGLDAVLRRAGLLNDTSAGGAA
jgi:4-hydroxy-tetrahydrodipicolinate synthase